MSGRPGRSGSIRAPGLAALAVLVVIVLTYANHFANGFHFDGFHSVVDNVYIRELRNIPRFFTDTTTFSSLPQNQAYRPLLLTSFALDYRLGGGLAPFRFQLTSFLVLLAQCALMAWLFAALGRPQEAIAACGQAPRLKPDFPLAAGNLRWAQRLAASSH